MSRQRLLITGANGLIAKIAAPGLARRFDICGIDLLPTTTIRRTLVVDITKLDQVSAAFQEFAPVHLLLHLAAVSNSSADWSSVVDPNINGTWNVFAAASAINVKRVVFASSNHATGFYEGVPPTLHLHPSPPTIHVGAPVRPDGPYGISKLAGEAIARYFHDRHALQAVWLRIGSVLSTDDPTRDERHLSTWLSHRDLTHLLTRALLAKDTFPGFGIYYGVSANTRRFWDISDAQRELQYGPRDDSSRSTRPSHASG